ncbi:hypothetical protein WJX75_001421 [Coccomyxa subellipsoidea]|uniref:Uncharacterized protein n=1 Tax=Coccomyxa subellipsoidea TaxID=248742 RepID=A0ABR2YZQ4_9CHLO
MLKPQTVHLYSLVTVPDMFIKFVWHAGSCSQQAKVRQGPEGRSKFQRDVRKIFGLQDGEEIVLSFGCKVPGTGEQINWEGWESFDAAVHCAAICAGERQAKVLSQAAGRSGAAGTAQRSPLNFSIYREGPPVQQVAGTCPPLAKDRLRAIIRQWRQTWKALRTVAPSMSEEGQRLHLDIRSSRGGPQFAASRDELYSLM